MPGAQVRELGLELTIRAGETIWTESSHKFDVTELIDLGTAAGFHLVDYWTDTEWPFAEMLFRAR